MTEEQEREAGERLAEIFCLKRSKEFPDRWVMGEGYFDKTSLGVFRVFKDVAKQLLPAYKAAPKMLEALKAAVKCLRMDSDMEEDFSAEILTAEQAIAKAEAVEVQP